MGAEEGGEIDGGKTSGGCDVSYQKVFLKICCLEGNSLNNLTTSFPLASPRGSILQSFSRLESWRPIRMGTVGPSGHVLTACAAANWMRSPTPTLVCEATPARLLQKRWRPRLGACAHSLARMREPSQAPGKQSWKAARMAARAASVHSPFAENCWVRVADIWVQMAGHSLGSSLLPPPPPKILLSRPKMLMNCRFCTGGGSATIHFSSSPNVSLL